MIPPLVGILGVEATFGSGAVVDEEITTPWASNISIPDQNLKYFCRES
jgi:hypothetical protein